MSDTKKRMAIMQPYFFPYIGYISLIKHSDEFMLFDPVQFINHGWIERNRVLKPIDKTKEVKQGENWQYISVPLEKHPRETKIKDIRIKNDTDWRKKIISQLEYYKKRALYYKETMEVVNRGLDIDTDSIVELNYNVLKEISNYLNIQTKLSIFSKENLELDPVHAPDEWALNICKARGDVDEYLNPIGGYDFFNGYKYDEAGIKLLIQKMNLKPYVQRIGYFEPGLSIIDVMMWNDVNTINQMLDDFEIIEPQKVAEKTK